MAVPVVFTCIGAALLALFCVKRIKGSSPTVAMIKALVSKKHAGIFEEMAKADAELYAQNTKA